MVNKTKFAVQYGISFYSVLGKNKKKASPKRK